MPQMSETRVPMEATLMAKDRASGVMLKILAVVCRRASTFDVWPQLVCFVCVGGGFLFRHPFVWPSQQQSCKPARRVFGVSTSTRKRRTEKNTRYPQDKPVSCTFVARFIQLTNRIIERQLARPCRLLKHTHSLFRNLPLKGEVTPTPCFATSHSRAKLD